MNILLILLFSIFLIGCCNPPILLKNGLTKKASELTVYYIHFKNDSLNKRTQDTLSIRVKKYNDNDQIIHFFQKTVFAGETLEIDYLYDDLNKIKTEIVKMSTDSLPFKVNYIYKDSLLYQSKSIIEKINDRIEIVDTYFYNEKGIKEKTISTQIFIDLKASDTIRNSESKNYFDENELIYKNETIRHKNPNQNRIKEFNYDCRTLVKTLEYNYKDSLISTTEYKYELDKFKNWIKKEILINDEKKYLQVRKIQYE